MIMTDRQTGYPSIDKPWLKYYSKKELPIPSPEMSMYAFLCENNRDNLECTAMNYYGRKISFRLLIEKIDAVASALRTFGINKGDIVSLCALNVPEFIYLLYALNKIGAVSNWIGITSPIADLHEQLVSTDSRTVFTINIAYPQIEKAAQDTKVETIISIPMETSMPFLMKRVVGFKNRHIKDTGMQWKKFVSAGAVKTEDVGVLSDDMAVIEYTGGSTGVPKGVMLSNKALNTHYVDFFMTNSNGIFNFSKSDKMISGVPFFLVFGMCACCHSPLCHGMELVLAPDPSPSAGTKIIRKYGINHVMGGRLLIEELQRSAQSCNEDLSYIKSIMYGGEETNKAWEKNIRDELKKFRFNAPILNSYGMSETSAGVLTAPDDATDGLIPCAGVDVKIVNSENCYEEYSYDREGELCISTDQLMLGYYNDAENTEEVFFEENGVRWLRTHDLAVVSSDGVIKITGRIKRIYSRLTQDKIQIRVYPMRIEEALAKNEFVRKCAVVGVKDDELAYRSIAYIILSDKEMNHNEAKKRLIKYCGLNLPDSHWPDEYVFIDQLPITRAGKIDYRALEKMQCK